MKINFKYAILSAALAVGMASCSDDPNVDGPEVPQGELTYFALDFLFGNSTTRAAQAPGETPGDGQQTPGSPEESTIKTISIFVFDKQTGAIAPPPTNSSDPSTKGNYYHLTVTQDKTKEGTGDAWQVMQKDGSGKQILDNGEPVPALTEHGEWYYQTKKLPVLSGEKEIYVGVNLVPQIAGDVANHGLNGIKNIAHKSRVELLSEDFFFSMFSKSATYINFEAKVPEDEVKPNGKNYAVCYVERMVAKVQVREDIQSKVNGWATVAASKTDATPVGKVMAEGMKWHVGNANTQVFAMANSSAASMYSNMDPNWTKDGWVYDTPAHEWTVGGSEPYYYAATSFRKDDLNILTDPDKKDLYGKFTYDETHFYHYFDFLNTYNAWRDVHNLKLFENSHPGFNPGGTPIERRDTIQYVMENTSEFAMRGTNTYASIKTTFIPYIFADKALVPNTDYGQPGHEGEPANLTNNKNFTDGTPATFYMVQNKYGQCFYFETPAGAQAYVTANKANLRTISYLTEADAPSEFEAYVLTYENGECYYRLYFGKKNVYNVARNVYYKATITSFIGRPGHNEPIVPEPEDPWPIDLEDGYCQFEIKVLPWTVYYDEYGLEY